MGKSNTVPKQFAEFEEDIVEDVDPEQDEVEGSGDDSQESDDDLAGTEHYAKVSKSKLRKPAEVLLGPEYSGARVTRDALIEDDSEQQDDEAEAASESEEDMPTNGKYADPEDLDVDMDDDDEDIDSGGALGDSDIEKFKSFTFRGSSKPKITTGPKRRPTAADFMPTSDDEGAALDGDDASEDESEEDILDVADQHSEDDESGAPLSDEDESESSQEGSDDDEDDLKDDQDEESGEDDSDGDERLSKRAELRKIMAEENKNVVATISQAVKADAAKGNAVKEQRKAFDSLLGVRMVLQKALIATNSMAITDEKDSEETSNQAYEGAEEAAIKLWNTLDSIRLDLQKATNSGTKKRKRDVDTSTPSSALWERMQKSEIAAIDNRQSTLDKWSSKVRGTASMPISKKLNPVTQQSLTSVLQDQLASSDHLIQRTKIPRSCAPIQRDAKVTEDANIYDDGNFYQLLLKELVDQRRVDSLANPVNSAGKAMQWTAVKEAKTRKVVDTKASKGRKLRFTVHEKLQNFMAPEDRRSWEPHAIDGFFGSLLGQKMTLGEDDEGSEGESEGGNGVSLEDEGLMLFRS